MEEEIPSPEEMVKRVDAALQEIGIKVLLEVDETPEGDYPWVRWHGGHFMSEADFAASWMAYKIAGVPKMACWACWHSGDYEKGKACREGNCSSPNGPATPPRELLQIRRH